MALWGRWGLRRQTPAGLRRSSLLSQRQRSRGCRRGRCEAGRSNTAGRRVQAVVRPRRGTVARRARATGRGGCRHARACRPAPVGTPWIAACRTPLEPGARAREIGVKRWVSPGRRGRGRLNVRRAADTSGHRLLAARGAPRERLRERVVKRDKTPVRRRSASPFRAKHRWKMRD